MHGVTVIPGDFTLILPYICSVQFVVAAIRAFRAGPTPLGRARRSQHGADDGDRARGRVSAGRVRSTW